MGGFDTRFYLAILLRRLPLLLAIIATATGLGLALAHLMPPVYRASARIVVEPPQIPADMARTTAATNPVEQLQIIEQEIITRENLLDLARRMNIYASTKQKLSDADIVDNLRARTSLELVEMDRGRDGRGATIFTVAFTARTGEMAARVVNELVETILHKNVGLRTGTAGVTMQFFAKEVARLNDELAAIEDEVLRFRNANIDALPDSIEYRRTQQGNQQERQLLLEREEAALRARRENLVKMFEATGQTATPGPLTPEQEMLRDLNRALAEQLAVFSPTSPSVVALQTRISALKESLKADDGAGPGSEGPSELDLQLSEIDERLGFITREKASIVEQLVSLERSINATPHNETRLSALERGRDNIRMQYNNAVAKLAEASTGEQIEMRSTGGRLSVIEPAVPPENRISPNRRRIVGAAVAAGLMLAIGLVLLLELSNRSVRRPAELSTLFDAPPLATIPLITLPRERRARTLGALAGLAGASCIAVAATAAVGHYRQPLAVALEGLIVAVDSRKLM